MNRLLKLALLMAMSFMLVWLLTGAFLAAWNVLAGDARVIEILTSITLAGLAYADARLMMGLHRNMKDSGEGKRTAIFLLLWCLLVIAFVAVLYLSLKRWRDDEKSHSFEPESKLAPESVAVLFIDEEEVFAEEETPLIVIEEEGAAPEELSPVVDLPAAKEEEIEVSFDNAEIAESDVEETATIIENLLSEEMETASTDESFDTYYEPYVSPRWEDDDFWSTFYIAGEDDLELAEGIYYFDSYINDNYSGQLTVYIDENGDTSVLKNELRSQVVSLLTDEASERIFTFEGEYLPLEEIEVRGVEVSCNMAEYTIHFTFNNDDMPVQTISIKSSNSRIAYRPIAGAQTLSPAVFTLNTRHTVSGYASSSSSSSSFLSAYYLLYAMSNSFRLLDLYGNFSLYLNYNDGDINFRLGSYSFYYDFPDQALRLSFGNISTDLLSARGTSIGIRLAKSLSYASDNYREKSYVEEYLVIEKVSDVRIVNEGREIYRKTLQPGNYRLQDFILYSGANTIEITVTPLDGSQPLVTTFNVNYSSSLITPGEVYYSVALATGRSLSTNRSTTAGTLSIPFLNEKYLEYNPLNLAASASIRAGLGDGLSLSATIAMNNRPQGDVLFIPSIRLSCELTHLNVFGTTRYTFNFYENAGSDGKLTVPYVYARIGHQMTTGVKWLSSLNLSLGYTSPTNYASRPERHYYQGSMSLSGSINGLGWSLGSSTAFYTDSIEDATYSVSASFSYSLGRQVFMSASLGVSGLYSQSANVYGRISANVKFGKGNVAVNATNSYYSTTASVTSGSHSVSSQLRTSTLADVRDYSLRTSYSYSGSLFSFSASHSAYDTFNRNSLSFSLSSSSLFADGLFVMSGYIPSNFLIIRQEGVLKGNEVTIGNIGTSSSRTLDTSFGNAVYTSLSSKGESLSIFSVDAESFGTTSTFDVNIPASRRTGYILRIDAESTYSLSSLVTLPDGNLWSNGSSPVYRYEVDEDGALSLERSDAYIFTDQDGRFIANDLAPGDYAFDVPWSGSWILYVFSVKDNTEEYGNMMMYEPSGIFEMNEGFLPEAYRWSTRVELTGYMSGDEFWTFLYPVLLEEAV